MKFRTKINVVFIAMGLSGFLLGGAQAATLPAKPLSKKITLTAKINDSIFVSKPDGSTWYGTEELESVDYTQKEFTKTLPIRVWSKIADFNLTLAQPLKMTNGSYEMADASVSISHVGGEGSVVFGKSLKVTQVVAGNGGFDEVHNLKISAKAPLKTGASTEGTYSGDLVMIFEPSAGA
ncbi:CS1 type fimbrial major subunit [Pseudomonas sp. 1912-s]|uniref:CS1 type fimbrial major subunit n=1 Tax=Pseudomonas sp. 1912-s TaxID=3033802 RepID=UPI0023DF4745|nr:CS1 type fimbrial major subunit [Pseudomonas sp. 1912-s]MDF3202858.1 CS1 type fimbrial major subunit [Pseudomonas sp. 1912-s]